ncbi:3-deoxy-manno-octulosonate cytidylyltransferase [Peijinzhouia sedimentorum]
MEDFVVVIPARYQSSRLPGKPLLNLEGKSLLLRTYERCIQAVDSSLVYVATDDKRIFDHCRSFNIQVVLTSKKCLTGTDRIAEFANKVIAKTYINVQGDEPLINPNDIRLVIETAKKYPLDIINGFAPIQTQEQYRSLSIPKVVFRPDYRLLYMSRSPIPGNKKDKFIKAWRQICVYAFPKQSLIDFSRVKTKTELEEEEDVEIIRFLELGNEVRMVELSSDSVTVDTEEDAEKVRNILKQTNWSTSHED